MFGHEIGEQVVPEAGVRRDGFAVPRFAMPQKSASAAALASAPSSTMRA
jgi:hypothetical protein